MTDCSLTFTADEKRFLLKCVRASIQSVFIGRPGSLEMAPPPPDSPLNASRGAFVTLKLDGDLRGCIGNLTGTGPLWQTVWRMAQAAAFDDPRFPPLTPAENARLDIEISVLSPLAPCPDSDTIKIGRDGLLLRKGRHQGVFLPQVPVEWGWDRLTYLEHLCRKAGLPAGAWKGPGAELFTFQALVFGEGEGEGEEKKE